MRKHGMTGQRNAAKPAAKKLTERVYLSLSKTLRIALERSAHKRGETKQNWIRDAIERKLRD
jgi:hypothetical protein